jgi:gamma-glutamylcyclotransferase (GGCT)/AIG2-like uncharacterized protein YtfP
VWPALDAYEGYDPSDIAGSLFVRTRTPATLSDGRLIDSWIYVYNQDPVAAPPIKSGEYSIRRPSPSRS